jgi:hypothetical protein
VRDYGAKGDDVTDDTQAFIQVLQSGRHQSGLSPSPQRIYVPPGRYLISSTLILWAHTSLVGEWTKPPTLILAPNSPGFQNAATSQPFLVTAGGYNVPDNTTDWQTRTENFNGGSNQTFSIRQSQNTIQAWNGLTNFTFLDINFQNTAPISINASDAYYPAAIAMINCHFANMPQGTFAQEPVAALLHFERMTFDAVSAVPPFL